MSDPGAVFVVGKGGAGKTTCALALSRALSERRRVMTVSLDPAHNLGDLAGRDLGCEPSTLAPGLRGCEPDLVDLGSRRGRRAVDLVRSGYRHLDVMGLSALPDLIEYAPGLSEQAALDGLWEVLEARHPEELIVVDMPPTGLATGVLALPALQLAWMQVLERLRHRILDRRSSIAHIRGREYLDRMRGSHAVPIEADEDGVLEEIRGERKILTTMSHLIARLARHVIVVNPDGLSIAEGGRIRAVLGDLGTDCSLVVINRCGAGDDRDLLKGTPLEGLESVCLPAVQEPRSADQLLAMGRIVASGF